MVSEAVVEALKSYVPEKNIHLQEPMKEHTTLRVGGEADCLLLVDDEVQLGKVLGYLKKVEIPLFVLGNGSNLLVGDKGYQGIVLRLGTGLCDIIVEGNKIIAGAGASMAKVAQIAMQNGLTGLEFASGIPGTIGGGVVMNAGAYGGEMSQVVAEVQVVDYDGEQHVFDNETMEFGYRHSAIKNRPYVVSKVEFVLQAGDQESIRQTMEELAAKRREKQPLEYPSAGSTFKRPEGYFAGELIMNANLRGYQIGGARVSDKHCGFLINAGDATAADFKQLISYVQECVQEKYGVKLEPEVIFLGRF